MRISKRDLEAKIRILNKEFGYEPDSVSWNTVGALRLYSAYGGYDVHRIVNESGGCSSLNGYCTSARELDRFLYGMIQALRLTEVM